MSETQTLMQAAADVARIAGRVALSYYRSALSVETKRDGSPVTIADREAERAVREWVAERFPRDGVLGEELGSDRPEARRRWIVDPIDGTKSFVRGVPLWGTLVAVAEGEEVLAGAAFFPAVDELVAAAPGEGCWHNGARHGSYRVVYQVADDEVQVLAVVPGRRPVEDARHWADID